MICKEACGYINQCRSILTWRVEGWAGRVMWRGILAGKCKRDAPSGHSNLGAWQVFFWNFNDTISREDYKTIYSGLSITGMAFSNQSELPAFFSLRQVSLKISHHILPIWEWPNPRRWLTEIIQIPAYDKPELIGIFKLTFRGKGK
jgi:hypothetical protein